MVVNDLLTASQNKYLTLKKKSIFVLNHAIDYIFEWSAVNNRVCNLKVRAILSAVSNGGAIRHSIIRAIRTLSLILSKGYTVEILNLEQWQLSFAHT